VVLQLLAGENLTGVLRTPCSLVIRQSSLPETDK
jgi:hypothetical protein